MNRCDFVTSSGLRLEYTQMRDTYGLEVQWQGPGIGRQPIAASCLKHVPIRNTP
jgi:hypothetical protein